MAYRQRGRAHRNEAAEARLRELASHGRAQRHARLVRERARVEHELASRSREGRANLRQALMLGSRHHSVLGLATAAIAVLGLVVATQASDALGLSSSTAAISGIAWAVVWLAIGWFGGYAIGGWAVRAEQQWLAALPFKTDGYLAVLEATPSVCCTVRVTLQFETMLPDRALVSDLLGLVGGDVMEAKARQMVIERPQIDCDSLDGPTTNAAVHHWIRPLVEHMLLPLHDAHPIALVSFARR